MQVVTGAMSPLLRKLGDLLMDELTLDKRTRKGVESLQRELTMLHAALHKVAEVPQDHLDPVVRVWARQVRELSYNMEDAVDAYMVRVDKEGNDDAGHPIGLKNRVKKFVKKTSRLFRKGKDLHQIVSAVDEAQDLARQLTELRQRYGLELHDANAAGSSIDPRLVAMYKDVKELVGINSRSNELIDMLLASDGSEKSLKTVSIVGFGGLGKTTLAKAVYDKIITSHFDCGAFVSIGRNPNMNKVFKDILHGLDKGKYDNIHNTAMDVKLLIDEVRCSLHDKRYFIIIDDIWNEKMWEVIKCAFPENNSGSRVITTTRIVSVSEKCSCLHHGIYKMKPLSSHRSKTLFYKRIFTDEKGCPRHLLEVSKNILKKCGGVPLAIITIASLLANKQETEEQWSTVLKSIGRGMTEGGTVDDMRKILSFSYHDLPSHLKSCLLYMSVFPEDYNIRRDRLIWTWLAQGFVQHKEQEDILFELGECCLNELINRSMVQLVHFDVTDRVETCQLHDMVLDLICSLSREENFVCTLDDVGKSTCLQSKVRRLSLQVQDGRLEHASPLATIELSHVRSFTGFSTTFKLIPSLQCFHVLRVLDLEGCVFRNGGDHNLSHISKLYHLRYLGLRYTFIGELPGGLGRLRFLQTLDLEGAGIEELPSDVAQLGQLRSLYVDFKTRLPDGIENLTSALVLSGIAISEYPGLVRGLFNMTRLRELRIRWNIRADNGAKSLLETLVESLCNLRELRTLIIFGMSRVSLDWVGERWVAPLHLRRFELYAEGYFSRMPAWIKRDPLLLTELSVLDINFHRRPQLQAEDMRIFGMMPALAILKICGASERLLIGPGFRCLRSFYFRNKMHGTVMFQGEAMPRVKRVWFNTSVRNMIDGGDPGLGLGNLPSLKHTTIRLLRGKATIQEVGQVESAVRQAIREHPNQVGLRVDTL